MTEGDVCRCVLRNPADGPDHDCWIHGESREELYKRASADGYRAGVEAAAMLFDNSTDLWHGHEASEAIRTLAPAADTESVEGRFKSMKKRHRELGCNDLNCECRKP